MRRTTGWIMPAITLGFLAYALVGPWLPAPWTHKGYEVGRLVGIMYMTLEGIFGVAVDVSSSLIILFTIYGAFLQYSGAGKFYLDFSFSAMGGKPTGAGRTVVLASFLLGGPSGSGVATTVTLGSVAYPMLEKVGYEKNAAGGLLAAGGLGAIISPPVLGAAAFLIAEFLKISYLDVLLMACIPTLLFYFALFLMVEIDARKYGMRDVAFEKVDTVWNLSKRYWFHFLSLVSIVVFMLWGFSPVLSVFWATVVALVTSFLRPETALFSYDLFRGKGSVKDHVVNSGFVKAMEGGSIGMLNVGATCAGAGIIVGVVALTGLGLKFSSIVIDYAARLAAADGDLHLARRVDRRARGAGDGVVHHLRGDRRAGADQARRAGLRGAHVHLLLRGALRGLAADGAVAVRGRGDHRRRSVQDDDAVLEVHRARVPGAVHVRARPGRPGPAADGVDEGARQRQLVVDRPGDDDRGARHRGARRRFPGLGAAARDAARARHADHRRGRAGLPGRLGRRGRAVAHRRGARDAALHRRARRRGAGRGRVGTRGAAPLRTELVMPRLPYKPLDDAGPEDVVAPIRARRGGTLLNLDRQLLYSPPLATGWNELMGAVRSRLLLPELLREIAICAVATINRAPYEFHHHAPLLRAAGASEAQVDSLGDVDAALSSPGLFDAAGEATLRLAVEMTRSVQVADRTFDAARRALADDRQLVELIGTIASYNMVSRVIVALGIEPE